MTSNTVRLADQISEAILEGEFPPGTRLDEAGLATRFGLSRTPVREALAEVCARGLAERRPYRGVEVVSPDPAVLLDRFEALAEIEALCASLAAGRAQMADLLGLEDLVQRMEDAGPEDYRQMNFDLHDRICRMARNAELARVADDLRLRLAAVRRAQLGHADRRQRSMREHRALVAAICDRDAGRAASVMRAHLRAGAQEVLSMAQETGQPPSSATS